jgi:nitrogen regulatory protein P-II 1
MKEIKAIIQPAKLGRVRDAFRLIKGFPGMSVTKVDCCGPDGVSENPRSIKQQLADSAAKIRIEIVCPEDQVERIVATLLECNRTGKANDGMVWVTAVDQSLMLCNGTPGWGTTCA